PPHEGVIIDDIAEERARLAKLKETDFPGSRNIPSTGLNIPEPTTNTDSQQANTQ
ncbi:hypothetical protein CPB86DRAFT_690960, partial [Serendipita vermifera]